MRGGALVLDGGAQEWERCALDAGLLGPLLSAQPAVTIAAVRGAIPAAVREVVERCDLVVSGTDAHVGERLAAWSDAVARRPQASAVLAQVLRVAPSLETESLAYSALQSGPEHAAWLTSRTARPATDADPRVVAVDRGRVREVTLTRPSRHNAFDARMRAELHDVLAAAVIAPDLAVLLSGAGPSFCSGGDLDEFGTLEDPVHAHLTRAALSPPRLLARLAGRTVAAVHGWCIGAGVELSAFARSVIAADDAHFRLPEISMGLLPGCGGTVSLRARIGRRRLLELAVTGAELDAGAALEQGLVDEVVPRALFASRARDVANALSEELTQCVGS